MVKLGASLGFVSGGELVATGLTDTIISRFRSTLALAGCRASGNHYFFGHSGEELTNKVMVVIEEKSEIPTGQSKASSANLDSQRGRHVRIFASTDTAARMKLAWVRPITSIQVLHTLHKVGRSGQLLRL